MPKIEANPEYFIVIPDQCGVPLMTDEWSASRTQKAVPGSTPGHEELLAPFQGASIIGKNPGRCPISANLTIRRLTPTLVCEDSGDGAGGDRRLGRNRARASLS
jgi:hypothetical protein